jgi:hypothetical protein
MSLSCGEGCFAIGEPIFLVSLRNGGDESLWVNGVFGRRELALDIVTKRGGAWPDRRIRPAPRRVSDYRVLKSGEGMTGVRSIDSCYAGQFGVGEMLRVIARWHDTGEPYQPPPAPAGAAWANMEVATGSVTVEVVSPADERCR